MTRLIVLLLVAGLTPAYGQVTAPTGSPVPEAAPQDVATIDAIMGSLYGVISGPAGEARNWDRFRSLFLPDAKLIPTGVREGSTKARARFMSVEDYIAGSGAFIEERGFFESEIARVVDRFENIAQVFSTYESRWTPEGDVFQRGINSVQLMWDGERWWIVNIMWRGVAPDAVIPPKYLPPEP